MGWFWGELDESCNDACARHGQICDRDWTRRNVLPDLQDYDSFVEAAAQADHNGGGPQLDVAGNPDCNEGTFENQPWSPWPAVKMTPTYRCGTSGTCQGSPTCGGEVGTPYGYSCGATDATMHRMCFCLPGALPCYLEPHISTRACTY